jgi:hypothetical protein
MRKTTLRAINAYARFRFPGRREAAGCQFATPIFLRLALHPWRIRIVVEESENARLYGALDQSFGV